MTPILKKAYQAHVSMLGDTSQGHIRQDYLRQGWTLFRR